jgi:hypothetical protein
MASSRLEQASNQGELRLRSSAMPSPAVQPMRRSRSITVISGQAPHCCCQRSIPEGLAKSANT